MQKVIFLIQHLRVDNYYFSIDLKPYQNVPFCFNHIVLADNLQAVFAHSYPPVSNPMFICGVHFVLFAFQVHVGADEYLHLRVHRPLPYENKPLSLHSVQTSKTQHDEIVYF